ncbi:MarR family winged helix-turn-helix transcriptional regulator [Thermomonospora catenispora]|uniref:MarR family winged helix-turn-helix transcriptional regulator n=1 Tax=Thermomonospora catenispora TaxID=2493090 RepID=UPI001120A088|nr:MarR family winged helix-turn-helix transcriptional regulator [Thermomonospora catenispora]TNY36744.1 MarR family transcriptional regulator [Thermomonospora catenispora]
MSTGPSVPEAVRTLLLLMPRVVGRLKRTPVPETLRSLDLAPRHLSLLSYLIFDGPLTVTGLAERLEVAPTTVSLMVSELSRKGVVERREDDSDRRRTIVSIAPAHQDAVNAWLAKGVRAWSRAVEPLTPEQRRMFIETLQVYERELSAGE